jgi:hypothetical protein
MELGKYHAAKQIQDEITDIEKNINSLSYLLRVMEQRPDKFNSDNIELSFLGKWRDCPDMIIPIPENLYITALQMTKKNYMERLTELTKKFEKL